MIVDRIIPIVIITRRIPSEIIVWPIINWPHVTISPGIRIGSVIVIVVVIVIIAAIIIIHIAMIITPVISVV
jgi:hypothetical protein